MRIQLGLAWRLALSFIALALLSQYLNYQSFNELLKAAVHQREVDKIKAVARSIEPRFKLGAEWVKSVSQLVQNDLSRAMQHEGATCTGAVTKVLDLVYQQSGVDVMEVTDEQGIMLYRAQEPNRNGDQATAWGIEEALEGKGNTVSVRSAKDALILFIEPIRDGKNIIGTVSTGKRIGEEFIKTLSTDTGAELSLVDRTGTVVASSHRGKNIPDPSAISEAFEQKIPSYRTNEETRTTVSYFPILIVDEAWVIMAEINSSSAFALIEESNEKASLISFFIMGGGILITLLILRFMLRPLRDLRRRAETMVTELTNKVISRAPKDDVISLVHTIDTLTTALVDHNRELTEQRADLRISAAAFESQQGMMIADAGTAILRVNKAYTEITGYTAEEVIGQTPNIFRADKYSADFNRQLWDAIHCTGKWQGEFQDQRKNGDTYPKSLTITAVKDNDGVVTHYIITHSDISERKKAEETIEELAFFDALTHLPNRRLLIDRLNQAITAGKRNGTFGALLFIDLDNFKTLNDTLGHDYGDLLLQQVTQRLVACIRADDTLARVGGDEFVVVLGGLSHTLQEAATQTEVVAEKILAALNHTYQLGDSDQRSSASIGATLFGEQETSIDDLLRQADLAMYKSKNSGRNTLCFFDPVMQTVVMERADLENDLRRALAENQFILYYQPQIFGNGHITGAEVLVRWQHPERGMVSPAAFIPLAEETGLILPLGHWVLETACIQLAQWASQPEMAQLAIAVNVSAQQFRHPDFVDQVLVLLEKSGANPQRLKLELTESMLIENVEEIIEKMLSLQSMGVSFSLDDFGTGYSSLSYLKRLPLEQLKIDQSFVRDVLIDPNDAAIAKTIVALAQSLGLQVIAEGVETEAQRDFLSSVGCHAYQGYYFSRPLPVERFETFSRESLISV